MDTPAVRPALSRVGLEGIETVIRLGADRRSAQPFPARLDCHVELDPAREGPPAPRFDEVIADVVRDVVVGGAESRAERLAQEVAERIRERQGARWAEVAITARFP